MHSSRCWKACVGTNTPCEQNVQTLGKMYTYFMKLWITKIVWFIRRYSLCVSQWLILLSFRIFFSIFIAINVTQLMSHRKTYKPSKINKIKQFHFECQFGNNEWNTGHALMKASDFKRKVNFEVPLNYKIHHSIVHQSMWLTLYIQFNICILIVIHLFRDILFFNNKNPLTVQFE